MSKSTFTTYPGALPQQILEMMEAETIQPGSPAIKTDDKTFRAVKFGEAVTAGKLVQAPAVDADFEDLVVAADAAVGATEISVTLGASGVTANQFEGGTIYVTNEAGEGVAYTVDNHPAADPAAVVVFQIQETVAVALTDATSVVTVLANPFVDVVNAPTTLTNKVLGVAVTTAAAGDFGFIQTKGVAPVLADGIVAANTAVYASAGVSGAVAAAANGKIVGHTIVATVDTEYKPVDLQLN
ncbi:MAG: hypothetical protein ACXABY_06690 [Candidatus Thorarchaeota archaeon]|jgi:hypothetical protein